jgi:murein DD-endopeptidase MepM/ murein hydrolase activator NlpD
MSVQRRIVTLTPLIALALCAGCSGAGVLSVRTSPYDQYVAMLQRAGLDKTNLGGQWTAASDSALRNAAPIVSPFGESGYFAAGEPTAAAYRLELQRGRRLVIEVGFESTEPGRLFVDLFRTESSGELRRVASLVHDEPLIEYAVDRTATYVLRLQPELLRSGRFTLAERTIAALRTFPVTGLTSGAVQSGFGAARDSGTRAHEGIDIFAPRGTPVVAVTDGIARPDTNGLGGNVVWLRDGLIGGTRYYYAHLDRWAIEGSTRVREGDVLGYIGNTGNARTTSSHLHFGVYDGDALDPAPFLQPDESVVRVTVEPALLGTLVRTRTMRTPLRAGPSTVAPQRVLLEPETIGQRLGIAGSWHRVLLPDGEIGYVAGNGVMSADAPLRRQRAARPLIVREKPQLMAPVMTTLPQGTDVELLGRFQQFEFIRPVQGQAGWVDGSQRR